MPEERTGIVTMGPNPMTLLGPEIKVGDQAPSFSALGQDMAPVNLERFTRQGSSRSFGPLAGYAGMLRGDHTPESSSFRTSRQR